MKTARRFLNNTEAEFARTLLLSAGIEAVLVDENVNGLGPGFAPGGARLMVPDESFELATSILNGRQADFTPLPNDFVPPEESVAQDNEPPPRLEGFSNVRKLIPAGLCILVGMGIIYVLFLQLAPLHWTHSAKDLFKMGLAADDEKDYAKAIKCFDAAAVLVPHIYQVFYDRGLAYYNVKNYEKAIADFTKTLELNPRHAKSCRMLGIIYRREGKYDEALKYLTKSIELEPQSYRGYCSRAFFYSRLGDAGKAIADYNIAIKIAAEESFGYNGLAWLYATCPKDNVRNGAKALELAMKACELSGWKKGNCIGTLAAAEAETGNFDDAVKHAKQGLAMAQTDTSVDKEVLKTMTDALAAYQQGKPYRDTRK